MIEAKYAISHIDPDKLLKSDLPEVCFLGRSNSGKSTLINRICNRKVMAHVSSVPGKTRQFNLFESKVDGKIFYICDLPGFGYAKFSKDEREQWKHKIIGYLKSRANLKIAFLLLDCKRTPGEEELFLQEYIYELGIHLVVIATKMDRLNQSEKSTALKKFATNFGLQSSDVIYTGTKINFDSIVERIKTLALE